MRDRIADGAVLRKMRDERQITQVHVAGLLDIGVWHLSRIENGKEQPSNQLALRIAAVYQCTVEDFSTPKAMESVA